MRLIKLALALAAVSISGAAVANPAVNSNVSGSIAGAVGASMASSVGSSATTQAVGGAAQVRLDGGLGQLSGGDVRHSRSSLTGSSAGGMEDSMPRGWLMALVTVLLIGHQLRRKHRFLRPQRFSDL